MEVTVSMIFEMLFLIGFGLSWPMNILKSIRSKTSKGKSLLFLLFALFAYICGILSKLTADSVSFVIVFYIINTCMVVTDVILWFVNHARDTKRAEEPQSCVIEGTACPYGWHCEKLL